MSHRRAFIKACETFGWTGGPGFDTRIVQMANGRERRNANWDQPQHSFLLPYGNIDEAAYTSILQMFLNVRGRNDAFLYRNRLNFRATDELFAVAEPGQTEFQLSKLSTIAGATYLMQVHALLVPDPNDSAIAVEYDPTITVNGAPTTSFVTDHDRARVVFAPMTGGEVLRWSGQFSHWVRFGSDKFDMTIENKGPKGFFISGDLELQEVAAPQEEASS